MATLKDILNRINGVSNTSKITQAMRMVSAAKLRRAQRSIESARPYFKKLASILANLVESVGENYSNPLVQKPKETNNYVYIIIASDRGLCGSFNNNLFREAIDHFELKVKKDNPQATIKLITVGKRTVQFFRKRQYEVIKEYPDVFSKLDFSLAQDINAQVQSKFINNEIDRVLVFYNEFKNVLIQVPASMTLLPIEQELPTKAKGDDKNKINIDYIFEPNQTEILDELLPKHLDIQVWRALLESHAAEHAARMMAMENATNNARDLIIHLQMVFNKKRQEKITTEMLEIVTGANALKKGS